MTATIPALDIRRRLGRDQWHVPRPFGPDGWMFDHKTRRGRVIVTASPAPDEPDGSPDWWHASIAWADAMPGYQDLADLHRAVWPNGWSYQLFAPPESHVNIHAHALHLWGRPDGSAQLPNFGIYGTI
jgi:hypothetical protein